LADKRFADDEEVETEMGQWLREESKDLYPAGFDALVKRRDTCFNVGGGYVDKQFFFPVSNITCFISILYPFVTYLLTLPRILEFSTVPAFQRYSAGIKHCTEIIRYNDSISVIPNFQQFQLRPILNRYFPESTNKKPCQDSQPAGREHFKY
jgi:hypothetical protein